MALDDEDAIFEFNSLFKWKRRTAADAERSIRLPSTKEDDCNFHAAALNSLRLLLFIISLLLNDKSSKREVKSLLFACNDKQKAKSKKQKAKKTEPKHFTAYSEVGLCLQFFFFFFSSSCRPETKNWKAAPMIFCVHWTNESHETEAAIISSRRWRP